MMSRLFSLADAWISRRLRFKPRYLPVLLAFLTDRCNLRCRMCGVYEHAEPDEQRELSTDEWRAVIDAAVRLKTMILSFSGGEPLLRDDLFDLICYASERGIAVHVCSNGTLIDEQMAKRFQDAGTGSVSISVESAVPGPHESLRGDDTFEKAVAGIRMLREFAPQVKVGINTLITANNYRGIADMIPFAESLDVHQIKFAPIHTNLLHRRKSLEEFSYMMFDDQNLEDLRTEVAKLLVAIGKTSIETNSRTFLKGMTDLYSKPRNFLCHAGYAACAVDPQGMVGACCDMTERMSVRDLPLDEIWRGEEFHAMRKNVHECNRACWDTTNTELSLRLSPYSLAADMSQNLRDIEFYFRRNPK